MRILAMCSLALLALIAAWAPSGAQRPCPQGSLGVSRIAEIDSTGGPWFGEPHSDPGFLAAGEIVLTFDDGPSPVYTRPILAALAAQCARATFFVIGDMAAQDPAIVREIVAQGHTVGTHTRTHANLGHLTFDEARVEIDSAIEIVEKSAGQPIAPFFRFPYLIKSDEAEAYLKSRNVALFSADIESLDWKTHDPKIIVDTVMAALEQHGKGIILLHDIRESTALALPELLSRLNARGFRIVHLRPKPLPQ